MHITDNLFIVVDFFDCFINRMFCHKPSLLLELMDSGFYGFGSSAHTPPIMLTSSVGSLVSTSELDIIMPWISTNMHSAFGAT